MTASHSDIDRNALVIDYSVKSASDIFNITENGSHNLQSRTTLSWDEVSSRNN